MTDYQTTMHNEPQKIEARYSPLRLIGILTLTAFCTVLLIIATFTRIKVLNCLYPLECLLHPSIVTDFASVFALKSYFYIPQVPIILFTAVLLGAACCVTSVFFYIVIGLALIPVFGLGGGFDYVVQPVFGYILGFIPAALVAGGITSKERSAKNIIIAALSGVLAIHITGFFYMLLVSLIRHENSSYIMDWLLYESLIRAVYDFVLGVIFMFVAKFFRKFIWILTSI